MRLGLRPRKKNAAKGRRDLKKKSSFLLLGINTLYIYNKDSSTTNGLLDGRAVDTHMHAQPVFSCLFSFLVYCSQGSVVSFLVFESGGFLFF